MSVLVVKNKRILSLIIDIFKFPIKAKNKLKCNPAKVLARRKAIECTKIYAAP